MRALVACVALAGLAADAIAQRVVEGPEPNASAATGSTAKPKYVAASSYRGVSAI
jgi:hypothetical protein